MWPRGAPTAAVQGQLGWFDVRYSRLLSAAGLWARLLSIELSISSRCVAADVARDAAASPRSWVHSLEAELLHMGVSHPANWGVGRGASQSVIRRRLRHVRVVLASHANAWYSTAVHGIETLHDYAQWQPRPILHPVVYGRHVSPALARYWGLARCGHHPFCDGRSARHRGNSIRPCRFCASHADTLAQCENGGVLEPDQGNLLNLSTLFSTSAITNRARDIANNVCFVASVCSAAEACEM